MTTLSSCLRRPPQLHFFLCAPFSRQNYQRTSREKNPTQVAPPRPHLAVAFRSPAVSPYTASLGRSRYGVIDSPVIDGLSSWPISGLSSFSGRPFSRQNYHRISRICFGFRPKTSTDMGRRPTPPTRLPPKTPRLPSLKRSQLRPLPGTSVHTTKPNHKPNQKNKPPRYSSIQMGDRGSCLCPAPVLAQTTGALRTHLFIVPPSRAASLALEAARGGRAVAR